MESYLRNAWYVAAWEEELADDALLARTLLGVPRVLYRRRERHGHVLLEDRCPHRFAPLSLGTRCGDAIECAYHGLRFDPQGLCVHNPQGGPPPARARIESLPVTARHGLVWFWPGDPARADPALIPDFSLMDQGVRRRCSHFRAHYELLADNLMDLSHVDFLHRRTFNTAGTHGESRHEVHGGAGETLWNTWLIPRVRRFPVLEPHFAPDEPIDQWTEMRWDPPASMILRLSWAPAGGDASAARLSMANPHIITPETESSSHYFWTCEDNDQAEAFARTVFDSEDKPMIEAVQSRMGSAGFWESAPLVLKGDTGAIRARRRLQRLRRLEAADSAAKAR